MTTSPYRLLSLAQAASRLGRSPGGSFTDWLLRVACGHVRCWDDNGRHRVFVDAQKVEQLAKAYPPRRARP
jgi:hypothetical protein